MRWYSQVGTPVVTVENSYYDPQNRSYTLVLSQSCPSSNHNTVNEPLLIPVSVALLDRKTGREIEGHTKTLLLNEKTQSFSFSNVDAEFIIPSILRDFSAPVKVQYINEPSSEDLMFLMVHDSDHYNAWECSQILSSRVILDLAKMSMNEIKTAVLPSSYMDAFRRVIQQYILVGFQFFI
jgi:aminopeptidase N